MVWEGWHREVSPYPDLRRIPVVPSFDPEPPLRIKLRRSGTAAILPVNLEQWKCFRMGRHSGRSDKCVIGLN